MEDVRVDDILEGFVDPVFLGGGGQKTVFAINHPNLGKVAIKIGRYNSQREIDRISREVELLNSISSCYFPKQFHFEKCSQSRYFIIEECIHGLPLIKHINDFTAPSKALILLNHLTKGMSIFWSKRVVHRDLKPENIIITDKQPIIIDLGIARIQDATSLTMTFAPFGPCTPNYASPEQLTNQKRNIDHRSDQYTLGIVFAQLLLNGVHPFDPLFVGYGSSVPENILNNKWHREAVQNKCSPNVFKLLERLLGHEPYLRFRRYDDLSDELCTLMENE